MKVQFELTPLPDDNNYPHEALQCSTTAVEILQLLQAEVENARNQSMLYIQLTFSSCHYLIDYILVQMYLPINNQKSLTSYANRLMKIASFFLLPQLDYSKTFWMRTKSTCPRQIDQALAVRTSFNQLNTLVLTATESQQPLSPSLFYLTPLYTDSD